MRKTLACLFVALAVAGVWLITREAVTWATTVVSLAGPPKLQFFDINGKPLSGGIVCTYAGGTTTPLAAYTDGTGGTQWPVCSTPGVGGIVLDAGGFVNSGGSSNIYYALGTSYKISVYNSSAVLQYTTDLVSVPGSPAGANGCVQFNNAGLFGCDSSNFFYTLATATLTVANIVGVTSIIGPISDKGGQAFNVMAYGAKCDGSTDDTSAFQGAWTNAGLSGISLPPGRTCNISSSVTGPYSPIHGFAGGMTRINWTGTGHGPVFSETGGTLPFGCTVGHDDCATVLIDGFTITDTGGDTGLVGLAFHDMNGIDIENFSMADSGGASIGVLFQISTGQSERNIIGPHVQIACAVDVQYASSSTGSSFGYQKILGANLDGHGIDVGAGTNLYHSTLIIKSNMGNGPIVSAEGTATNNYWDIEAETTPANASCHPFQVSTGKMITGHGFVNVAGCIGGNTLTGTGYVSITQAGDPGDGAPFIQTGLGNYDGVSGTSTTYIGTASRDDLVYPLSMFGLFSNDAGNYYGGYLWAKDKAHPNEDCFTLLNGNAALASSTVNASICQDGTIRLGQQGVPFASLGTPTLGSEVYCSDCTNTIDDGHTAGAACAGSGHGAHAVRGGSSSAHWACF